MIRYPGGGTGRQKVAGFITPPSSLKHAVTDDLSVEGQRCHRRMVHGKEDARSQAHMMRKAECDLVFGLLLLYSTIDCYQLSKDLLLAGNAVFLD